MDVVELHHLLTEGQMGIGLTEAQHPLFVFAEGETVVVHTLVDMTLEFVDELLLGESVNLLRHEGLVVAHGGDEAASQCKSLIAVSELMRETANEPALLHHLLNLFGVGHHLQTGAVEEVAHLFPREGFACFNQHGHDDYLDIRDTQFTTEVGEGVLHRRPEFVGEF